MPYPVVRNNHDCLGRSNKVRTLHPRKVRTLELFIFCLWSHKPPGIFTAWPRAARVITMSKTYGCVMCATGGLGLTGCVLIQVNVSDNMPMFCGPNEFGTMIRCHWIIDPTQPKEETEKPPRGKILTGYENP